MKWFFALLLILAASLTTSASYAESFGIFTPKQEIQQHGLSLGRVERLRAIEIGYYKVKKKKKPPEPEVFGPPMPGEEKPKPKKKKRARPSPPSVLGVDRVAPKPDRPAMLVPQYDTRPDTFPDD